MTEQLRILYVSLNQPWRGGGTFYRAIGFARHLVCRGHEVTLLTTSIDQKWQVKEEIIDGVLLVTAPAILTGKLRSGWDPYEILRRVSWLRGRRYDLVHAFESRPVVIHPALYARRQNDAALIMDWCDWFGRGGQIEERSRWIKLVLNQVETFYEEGFRHLANGTTVINSPLEKRALDLGVEPETIHWLPNGAETEKIKVIDRSDARQALNLDSEAVYIGYLGQAFPNDAQLLASAFSELRSQHHDSNLILVGNHRTDIASYLRDRNWVTDVGYVSDEQLNLYLAACDLLWLPLRDTLGNRGRWPLKINDYMSSGRAVVSTGVGDLVTLFQGDHPIGRLARDNPADFARQTLALLQDDHSRAVYEQNARFLAETVFNWKSVTEKLEAFYYRILGTA